MKAIVTKLAFYQGQRLRPGAEVEVPAGLKGSWFVPAAEYKAPAPAKRQVPVALSKMSADSPKSMIDVLKD